MAAPDQIPAGMPSSRASARAVSKAATMMAKAPTAEAIGASLSAREQVLLFCLGSDTEWVHRDP